VWAIGTRDNDSDNEVIGSVVVRGGDQGWSLVHESEEHMRAIWGRGETDIWIAGARTLRHFDGESFQEDAAFGRDANLGAFTFFSRSDDDAWLVGFYGLLWHFDGTSWRDRSLGTAASLWGGWATARDDAWIVGEGNLLAHWDGDAWTQFAGPRGSFNAVAGARDTMWIVGYDGYIAARAR
jgi:hypothetical protein